MLIPSTYYFLRRFLKMNNVVKLFIKPSGVFKQTGSVQVLP